MRAQLPQNEPERLAAVYRYSILDTSPEPAFDALTRAAAHLLGVPIALVSFVDENRQWMKSHLGLNVCETNRDSAFCAHAILSSEPTVVLDATLDPRFADNPLVTGEPGIRFYAGVPLITGDGLALGSFCVIDVIPRERPRSSDLLVLQDLAKQVMDQLEFRRAQFQLTEFAKALDARQCELETANRQRRISEDRLRFVLEAGHMGSFEFYPETGRITWSIALCRIFGVAENAAPSSEAEWLQLIHPLDRPIVWSQFDAGLAWNHSHDSKYRILRPDGQTRWVESRNAVTCDPYGRIESVMGVVWDVTERELAFEQVRESEQLFRTLSSSCPVGIFRSTSDGQMTYVNPRLEAIWKLPASQMIGYGWRSRVHPQDAHRLAPAWEGTVGEGESYSLRYRLLLPDESVRHVLARAAPMLDDAGRVIGMLGTIDDITDQEQLREEVRAKDEVTARILDSTADCVEMLDLDGSLVYISPAGQRALKISDPTRFVGVEWATTWAHEGDQHRMREALRVARGGDVASFNGALRVEGESRWWDVVVSPICDADGAPYRLLAVSREVTEQYKAAQERERLLFERSAVLNCAATGMLGIDTNGLCTFLNPRAEELLEVHEQDWIGLSARALLGLAPSDGSTDRQDPISEALFARLELHCDDDFFRSSGGRYFPVEYHASPLLVRDTVEGAIISFLDISDRKQHEKEKADLLCTLDEAVRDLGRVQMSMLRATPEECQLGVDLCLHPKHAAGGDFLCQYKLPDSREVVLLTDVSGHDLRAAYFSAHSHGMVRAMLDQGLSLDGIFEGLNRALLERGVRDPGMAVSTSACAMVFDPVENELSVRNAGSPAPVYVDDGGLPHNLHVAGSHPLGWFDQPNVVSATEKVSHGFVLLWTDGLQDLAYELEVTPLTLAITLLRSKAEKTEAPYLSRAQDDVMSACIRLPGDNRPLLQRWIPLLDETYTQEMCEQIDALQANWARNLEFAIPGLRDASLFDILLCTREAVLNGLKHGCVRGGLTRLSIRYNQSLSQVMVRVSDPGNGHAFDAHIHDSYDLLDQHRGLFLIRQFAHGVETSRNGATIDMTFDLWATALVCGESLEDTFDSVYSV